MSAHYCASFTVASYNVDGLSDNVIHKNERCVEISNLICSEEPDLIFFQEATIDTTRLYSTLLGKKGYNLVSPQHLIESPYFTLAFSKVSGVCKRLHFKESAHSNMGRDILSYEVVINNRTTRFLSSHLESLADSKDIRKAQLEAMLCLIAEFDGPSILAGDLNIRNKEADEVLNKMRKKSKQKNAPFAICDCWESLGRNEKTKNTWVHADPSLSHIQARYDRIYCNGHFIKATDFKLIGKDRMPAPVYTTPSDHFGMIADFVIEDGASVIGSDSDSLQISTSNEIESKKSGDEQEKIDATRIKSVAQKLPSTDSKPSKTKTSSLESTEKSKKRKVPSTSTDRDGDDRSGDSEKNSRRMIMAQAASRRLLSLNNSDSSVSAVLEGSGTISALGESSVNDDVTGKAASTLEDTENVSTDHSIDNPDPQIANDSNKSASPKRSKKAPKVVIDISDSPPSNASPEKPKSPRKPRSPKKPKSSNIGDDVEIISLIDDKNI